ncbi:MAG: hypothetical protein WCP55_24710 [Lentisphaerota bacterium]
MIYGILGKESISEKDLKIIKMPFITSPECFNAFMADIPVACLKKREKQ